MIHNVSFLPSYPTDTAGPNTTEKFMTPTTNGPLPTSITALSPASISERENSSEPGFPSSLGYASVEVTSHSWDNASSLQITGWPGELF